MKIRCECGDTIHDSSDYISYKGCFIADQDIDDLCEFVDAQFEKLAALVALSSRRTHAEAALRQAISDARNAIRGYALRSIYQCTTCGRLFVDDAQFGTHIFVPNGDTVPTNLMRSIKGDEWKRPLRGSWRERWDGSDKGELWWGGGGGEQGYEQYDDLEALKRRYFEVFARLREQNVLRDAFLRTDEGTLHEWP